MRPFVFSRQLLVWAGPLVTKSTACVASFPCDTLLPLSRQTPLSVAANKTSRATIENATKQYIGNKIAERILADDFRFGGFA